MQDIILASNNKHKIKEFKKMLSSYNILSLEDIGFFEDVVEDGKTFEENALIKAKAIAKYAKDHGYNCPIIADDSGLCCPSLDNAPGVYSARYAGNHDDQKNRDKLRRELTGKSDRTAFFVCDIVLYISDEEYRLFEGKTYGIIIDEERGSKDFGYDCIFLSDELNKTFGEATEDEKNSVSHRGRAILSLVKELTHEKEKHLQYGSINS